MGRARKAKRAAGSEFKGRRVAVAFNRHECLPSHPRKPGEHCFPVRAKPSSSSKVLAYVDELWLEDVAFFVSPSGVRRIRSTGVRTVCCFVVGTVIGKRSAAVTKKHGWGEVRLDVFDHGCFYRARDGACLRTAKFARLRNRGIEAFGMRRGDPIGSMRDLDLKPNPVDPDLATYGPRRSSWRGEMGGLNYEPATAVDTAAAIRWVQQLHPGAVIVDGSDDWDAPLKVRPEPLVRELGIEPIAWWHTGISGQCRSGVVLAPEQYRRFQDGYRAMFGCQPESCGFKPPVSLVRPKCGCWGGEGLRVYSSAGAGAGS